MRAVTVKAAARRDEELHVLLVLAHLAAVLAALAALAMGSCWAWACAAERNAEPEGPVAGTAGLLGMARCDRSSYFPTRRSR